MEVSSTRSTFERDLIQASERYRGLHVVGKAGSQFLKGILDIPDGGGGVATSFAVEIKYTMGYPKRFPYAYEVGGDIPVGADTHKGLDNRLCLTVEPREILMCRRGITVMDFIGTVLIPHLAHQYYRRIKGSYLQEYGHGLAGIREFYAELFGTTDDMVWRRVSDAAFGCSLGRNDPCPCGSGVKYKQCHQDSCEQLRLIGKEQVERDFKKLYVL